MSAGEFPQEGRKLVCWDGGTMVGPGGTLVDESQNPGAPASAGPELYMCSWERSHCVSVCQRLELTEKGGS